jgi:[ribosomal protein S5]-alanine N-acetyltransferase
MPGTPEIGLVPIDRTVAREAADAGAAFVTAHALVTEGVRELMAGVIGMTPAHMLDHGAWGGFFVFDSASRQVVGTCGFKMPPDADGAVEIAYYTFPPFERRGYAGAMARELTGRAQAATEVRTIVAHTLAEPNASTRILKRAGFDYMGEIIDPEDGRVWRWAIEKQSP